MMGRRLRDQCGQTAAEYMGLLVVVGLIIAAIASSGIGAAVAAGIERAVCLSVGDGPCPTVQAQLAQDREGDDEQARRDAAARERRERQRAFEQLKATTAQSMSAVAGSMQPLDEVEGQSAGDWLLSGLGELSGANDADRGISQLGESDILWKTGYYDPSSRVFVGSADDVVTTVINNTKPSYIRNLRRARP